MASTTGTSQPDRLDCFICEPEDEYHAKAASYLSSHALADFRKCPLLYWKKKQGLIDDEDRPAYLVGRAAHTLILEGREKYEDAFAVGGPVNPKTGELYGSRTKAFAQWAAAQGKPVLTGEQVALVEQMAAGVASHELATQLLSKGRAEGVVRTEYCGVPCQIRVDWFHPELGIADLKTCDDLTWFEADARRYGYVHQLAFYRSVLQQAATQSYDVFMIAVEKKEPYRCGVWRVADDALAVATQENEQAIERLKLCIETDVWPTGYAELRVLDCI